MEYTAVADSAPLGRPRFLILVVLASLLLAAAAVGAAVAITTSSSSTRGVSAGRRPAAASSTGATLSILSRPATASDALPPSASPRLRAHVGSNATIRLAVSLNGSQIYIARAESGDLCLMVFGPASSGATCTPAAFFDQSHQFTLTATSSAGSYLVGVVADDVTAARVGQHPATPISGNLVVQQLGPGDSTLAVTSSKGTVPSPISPATLGRAQAQQNGL